METLAKTIGNNVMKLNQYEWDPALDILGKGAFAEVFRARDYKGNTTALKIYTQALADGSTGGSSHGKYTLEKEYEKGKLLSHTNVIRYLDFEYIKYTDALQRSARYPVLIMEYADQGSLSGWLKSTTPPSAEDSLKIIRGILNGLTYLHEQGIIHRDLKPANILFKTDRLGNKVVKISDFGISRDLLEDNTESTSTTTGVGTVEYMAPEQLLKNTYGLNGQITNRTDIWAIGVIFYRLLSGKMPFGDLHKGYERTCDEIINKEPDYSNIPAEYQPVIRACLQKHASNRPASAQSVAAILDKVNDDGGTKILPPPNPLPPGLVPAKRVFIAKYISVAGAVVLVAGLVVKLFFGDRTVTNMRFKNQNGLPYFYSGPVKDSIPNGIGTAIFDDSTTYTGEFKNGIKDSTGKETYKDRATYSGTFSNDNRDGKGTYTDKATGESYDGYWKDGLRDGRGDETYPGGSKYSGKWKNGVREGFGVYTSPLGETYTGEWKNGLKDGHGVWKQSTNGDKYCGTFLNGQPNGYDTLFYANKDVFLGNFTSGTYSYGTRFYHTDRAGQWDKYVGEFSNEMPNGQGIMNYHDGSKYDGQWKDGQYNGLGILTYKNGSGYKANWSNGAVVSVIQYLTK